MQPMIEIISSAFETVYFLWNLQLQLFRRVLGKIIPVSVDLDEGIYSLNLHKERSSDF